MPVVPIEQNRVGIADGVTDAKLRPADFAAGTEAIARGLQGFGKGVGDAAEYQLKIANINDEAAVRTMANSAEERKRTILYDGQSAYYNQQGLSAAQARDDVVKSLTDLRQEVGQMAGNHRQRRLFEQIYNEKLQPELDKIYVHADRETAAWNVSQTQASQELASRGMQDNVNDPGEFERHKATLVNEVYSEARQRGLGEEWATARSQELVSSTLTGIVDRKMIDDPVGAAAYYRDHSDQFVPADRVKIEKALYDPLMERQASADVDGLMGSDSGAFSRAPDAPAGGGSILSRMVAITAHSESRNQDFNKDGSLVTSKAGAQGRMQTLPSTQADPGFGVRPAQDDSVAEKARVGRDYLAAMVRRYNGDPSKAWAAYNAGPGRVDEAVRQHGAGWLAAMPQETRDYVSTNVAALGGNAPVYAPRRDDAAALYARIDAQPWDFERKKQARAELDKRIARDDHLQNRVQEDAKDQAFETINKLGPNGFTSINQLPPEVRRNLSPEVTHSLMEQADQNARGDKVKPDGDTALALNLLAIRDPDAFKTADLRLYRDKVTPSEFASLAELQAKARNNPGAPEQVAHNRIWSTIDRYAPDLGLDLGTKDGKAKNPEARADAMRIFTMMQSDLMSHTGGKRQPTDDEVKQAFDRATITVKTQTPGVLGGLFGNSVKEVRRFRVPQGATYQVGVPVSVRQRIEALFRQQGVRNPSEVDVSQVYIQHKGEPGFWD